jgi:hypothetical protein
VSRGPADATARPPLVSAPVAYPIGVLRAASVGPAPAGPPLYLVSTGRRKNRANPPGEINAWKPILNALTVDYGDRIQASN